MSRPVLPTLLAAALAAGTLAFAPAQLDEGADAAGGTALDLSLAADGAAVTGTLDFGGPLTIASDAAGDASVAGAGLDLGDVRFAQEGTTLVVELDVLDTVGGEVAPTALYKVDLPNNRSLMAYRGPGVWDYQLADFSDGYSSEAADGSYADGTITWRIPLAPVGSRGGDLFPSNIVSTQGISPAGLLSLQLSAFVEVDGANATTLFTLGGRVDVVVTDADGAVVDQTAAFPNGAGQFSYDGGDLPAGTYTVTATSGYADLEATTSAVVTVG